MAAVAHDGGVLYEAEAARHCGDCDWISSGAEDLHLTGNWVQSADDEAHKERERDGRGPTVHFHGAPPLCAQNKREEMERARVSEIPKKREKSNPPLSAAPPQRRMHLDSVAVVALASESVLNTPTTYAPGFSRFPFLLNLYVLFFF